MDCIGRFFANLFIPRILNSNLQELSDVPCARRSLERLHISVSSSDRDKGIYTLQKSEHLTAFRSLKVRKVNPLLDYQ